MILQHAGLGVFMSCSHTAGPASCMNENHAIIVPSERRFRFQKRHQTEALELILYGFGNFGSGEFADGRQKIQMRREVVDFVGSPFLRPPPK